jgi:hypothetical protein
MTTIALPDAVPDDLEILDAVAEQAVLAPRHGQVQVNARTIAAQVVGISVDDWSRIDPSVTSDNLYAQTSNQWSTFTTTLGQNFSVAGRGRAVVMRRNDLTSRPSRWSEAAEHIATVADATGVSGVAFISADNMPLAVLHRIPDPYIAVVSPVAIDRMTRISLTGLRPLALAEDDRPVGARDAAEVRNSDGVLLGWAAGRVLWLRFHPLLHSGRLSFSSVDSRLNVLIDAVRAAGEHLTQPAPVADDEAERIAAVREAMSTAVAAATAVLTETARARSIVDAERNAISNDIDRHNGAVSQAQDRLARLRDEIRQLEETVITRSAEHAAATQRLEEVPDADAVAVARAANTTQRIREALHAVQALAMVDDARLIATMVHHTAQTAIEATSHPLNLSCAGTLRHVGPVTLTVAMTSAAEPGVRFADGVSHPALGHDSDPWDASAVPLAEAVGRNDARAVCQLMFGALARPTERDNDQLAACETDARPGYQPVVVAAAPMDTTQAVQSGSQASDEIDVAAPPIVSDQTRAGQDVEHEQEPAPRRPRRPSAPRPRREVRALAGVGAASASSAPRAVDAPAASVGLMEIRNDPTGQQAAIVQLLLDDGPVIDAADAYRYLTQRGFPVARAEHVRVILRRMTQRGYLQQAGRGRWRLAS